VGIFDKSSPSVLISLEDAEEGWLVKTIHERCYQLHDRLWTAFIRYDKKQNGKVSVEKVRLIL
jgi:hypothetical protein